MDDMLIRPHVRAVQCPEPRYDQLHRVSGARRMEVYDRPQPGSVPGPAFTDKRDKPSWTEVA